MTISPESASSFTPTPEFFDRANKLLREVLMELRPTLLEATGQIEHKLKDDKSVVTEMDVMVEKRLHAALSELDASIGLQGEETGATFEEETFWLVDPIDGTESFVRGLPFATNMIALIHEGEPIFAVIYNFMLDEYFHAVKGEGATMNGHPITVSDRSMDRAYIDGGLSRYDTTRMQGMAGRLRNETKTVFNVAASGYEFTAIARGATEGMITYGTSAKQWDMAPGTLIVQEAGGRVSNIGSDSYNYLDIHLVASNAKIHDELKTFMDMQLEA